MRSFRLLLRGGKLTFSGLTLFGGARIRVTGLRPHKANLFTTYSLREGPLNGLRLGGGVRYDAANYAGQDAQRRVLRGRSFTNVDLMASYTRKILGRRTTFQLNVRDAFRNDSAVSPSVINPSGNWDTILISPPRQLTATVRVAY